MTAPQLAPFTFAPVTSAPVTATATADDAAEMREAFRTKADSIEIEMDEGAKRASLSLPRSRESYPSSPSAPSTSELLERAAALGPARTTWESIVLPADPILDEKRQPRVAERRARLTRFVKLGLGACLAMCVVALGVGALSGDPESEKGSASSTATIGKTVASKAVVPIETLESTKRAKAVRRVAPVTTAAIVRTKRR